MTIDAPGSRDALERWQTSIRDLFDVSDETAGRIVALLSDRSCWMLGPAPGLHVIRVPPGPSASGALALLIRGEPGSRVPMHLHVGEERMVVLDGRLREEPTGRILEAGEQLSSPPGSSHELHVLAGAECLCAVLQRSPGK